MFKKIILAVSSVLVSLSLSLSLLVVPAFAAPETLNWGTQINTGECQPVGKPVVNVVQSVVNDVDSGEGGNYWAFDNFTRRIQVWTSAVSGQYCAEVQYVGQFDAQAGQTSPGTGGTLDGDEDGAFEGGYRATITGSLDTTPGWSTRGLVGLFDYECDINTSDCPGYVNWSEQYFDSISDFDYDWWGWIYHAGDNGTWVNSIDGNSGDIN